MPIRLGGLVSGFDTEAIIRDMMSAQSLKQQNIKKKLTKLEWKEEKWKALNTKLYNLYRNEVSKLKSQSSYLTKSVTSSDDSKVKVTAGAKVPPGSHTLSVTKMATAQYTTGAQITTQINGKDCEISDSTRITEVEFTNLDMSEEDKAAGKNSGFLAVGTTLELETGGKKDYFTIQSDTTISNVSSWFKERGIAFSYDTSFKRFHVSSMQTGTEHEFQLTSTLNTTAKSENAHLAKLKEYSGLYNISFDAGNNKWNIGLNTGLSDDIKNDESYKAMIEDIEFATQILTIGTDSKVLEQRSKNVFTAAAKAQEEVKNLYLQKNPTTPENYNFNTFMNENEEARNLYFNTYTSGMNTLNSSQSSLDAGKTASEILGFTKGQELEEQFCTINKTDMLSCMVGGVYALTGDNGSDIQDAINNYSANKDKIQTYAKAADIAQKEVYKAYIEKSWKSVVGDSTDFKLEWDADGNYSITKENKEATTSLATIRQQMNEYKNKYDFDQLMLSKEKELPNGKTYRNVFDEKLSKFAEGNYEETDDVFVSKIDLTHTFGILDTPAASRKNALDLIGIGKGATTIDASNMKCTLNGCDYESGSNTVTINGLTITALGKTTDPITLNVNNDSASVVDMVKSFIKQYNEVLKEASDQYYAKVAKGYDVLTDEEKEQMTDDQVEKWEDKIKDQLLRRDSTLNGIISVMRSIATQSVTVNGKEYNLSMFGINTGDYSERGLLHLDGDPDDPTTSGNENKLKAAIEDDPDIVMQVLSTIGNTLYTKMSDKMASTKLSSALTFYNDKEITDLKKSYEDQIKVWDKKLKTIEDNYYKKFSKMESAMSKLNSQTSHLTSLFGSGN